MDYRSNRAWQGCDDLAVAVYRATETYPEGERYGLVSQMRRAAVSAAANVAEGYGRATLKDLLHFLYQARGSLHEVAYFVHLSARLGYLDAPRQAALSDAQAQAARALQSLIHHWETQLAAGRTKLDLPTPQPPSPNPQSPSPNPRS
ncbi:MAG: four helix bundle protein [Anaerolineae bacterium]|nr:four helix bundle protein [Anaerolineae bacterium]